MSPGTKHDSISGWFDYSGYVTISVDRRSVAIELTDGGYGGRGQRS